MQPARRSADWPASRPRAASHIARDGAVDHGQQRSRRGQPSRIVQQLRFPGCVGSTRRSPATWNCDTTARDRHAPTRFFASRWEVIDHRARRHGAWSSPASLVKPKPSRLLVRKCLSNDSVGPLRCEKTQAGAPRDKHLFAEVPRPGRLGRPRPTGIRPGRCGPARRPVGPAPPAPPETGRSRDRPTPGRRVRPARSRPGNCSRAGRAGRRR